MLIAAVSGRPLETSRLPAEAAISIVTLGELELGVHLASDELIRRRRLATLRDAQTSFVALPVDQDVASAFAELVAGLRRRGAQLGVQDAWIAATARALGVPLFSQDEDFRDVPDLELVLV